MVAHPFLESAMAELLDGPASLTLDELARACRVGPDWIVQRVQSGVLQGESVSGHWHFSATTVVRARRLARLESTFDADPQLAALTTDLIEEVTRLRQQLQQARARIALGD